MFRRCKVLTLLLPLLCFSGLAEKGVAFSFPPLFFTSNNNGDSARSQRLDEHDGHEYRLVDHADQLKQVVRPPHLFSLPAPGGNVCLVVDENGDYHAVRDRFPPLGKSVSESGIVDTEVNVIEDMLFGTRFHLSDGSVRGRLCPGGTAGPLLRLTRLLRTISTASMFQRASRIFERRDKRYPENASASGHANDLNKLEVLAVRAHTDGSLNITLPPTSSVDHSRESVDATTRRRAMTTPAPPALTEPSWVKRCGLAGYNH